MWQRKQTLYLIVVLALMIAAIVIPNAEFTNSATETKYQLNSQGLVELAKSPTEAATIKAPNPCTYLFGVVLFLTTFVISKYKNRKVQFRLATINLILIFIYIIILAAYIYVATSKLNIDRLTLKYPTIFPIIALILNFLAMRGIMKDENLIKSMDRLR